jgi:DNA-binding PadR family transcriptional regulator
MHIRISKRHKSADARPMFADQQLLILELLAQHSGWLYGLELAERSDARLGRATIYVHLDLLEDHGHVESREEPNPRMAALPRRQYRITPSGYRRLAGLELGHLVPA